MRKRLLIILAPVFAAFVILMAFILHRPALTVSVLDVGQGDSILIQSGSEQVLIDGGPDATVLSKLGRLMPFGDRTIEYAVVTHAHADHITGIRAVAARYHIAHLVISSEDRLPGALDSLSPYVGADTEIIRAKRGMMFRLGDAATFAVLWPDKWNDKRAFADENDSSVVLGMRATEGTARDMRWDALFMGDATMRVEAVLAKRIPLRATFLKVGHHGSAYSSSADFLALVSPANAAISVGAKNRYGHPAPSTVTRLNDSGTHLWRTDLDGDVSARIHHGVIDVWRGLPLPPLPHLE